MKIRKKCLSSSFIFFFFVSVGPRASAQRSVTIDGVPDRPQLLEIPVPQFADEKDADLPQFDATGEILALLQKPEFLAGVSAAEFPQKPKR